MKAATLLILLLLFPPLLAAQERELLLDAVKKSGLPLDSLSLLAVVHSAAGNRALLEVNARSTRIPASVTKLITAAAVFREIPLGTRFETRLLSNAPREGSTLRGDLVLKGGGDPSLLSENLWLLVNRLAQSGIGKIDGDIIVDDSYFDAVLIDPGRDTKRSEMAYDAPVSALSFNWNAMALTIQPGARVGDPARVSLEPASDYVQIHSTARTVAGNSIARLVASRRPTPEQDGDILSVSGEIGINASPFESYRNVSQPALWAGSNLKLYLAYRGIQFGGQVRHGQAPDNSRLLAKIEGRPVEQLVVDMNKVSSNFIAEMLAKNLAARRQPPGSMAAGMAILNEYMAALGLDSTEYALVNPSGLTRQNHLSANALVRVLEDMGRDFRVENEFMASLPISGIDGTLRNRMGQTGTKGWVRAKTGYIDGAVSLAGYIGRGNGERVTFAFLYNGPAPAYQVRALFDKLSSQMVVH